MPAPATLPPPALPAPPATDPGAAPARAPVVIQDQVTVPSWIHDLESFRRWAKSHEFPDHGRFSFLDGDIWVDLSMEQLFTHSRVKLEFGAVLRSIEQEINRGYLFPDGVLLSHPEANLSTEADLLFVLFESLDAGRVRLIEGAAGGYVEVEGSPDMSLEIVSSTTERKDNEILRELYWRARVSEYWLVDVRNKLSFQILRWTSKAYRKTKATDGWVRSEVFDRWFRLLAATDSRGNPSFRLEVREDDPRAS
jgi:Uma2 family endonuclease